MHTYPGNERRESIRRHAERREQSVPEGHTVRARIMSMATIVRLLAVIQPLVILGLMLEGNISNSLTYRMFKGDPSAYFFVAVMSIMCLLCLLETGLFLRNSQINIARRYRAEPYVVLGICLMGMAFTSFQSPDYSPTLSTIYFASGMLAAMLGVRIATTDLKFVGVASV